MKKKEEEDEEKKEVDKDKDKEKKKERRGKEEEGEGEGDGKEGEEIEEEREAGRGEGEKKNISAEFQRCFLLCQLPYSCLSSWFIDTRVFYSSAWVPLGQKGTILTAFDQINSGWNRHRR